MRVDSKKVEDRKFARLNAQEVIDLIELNISLREPIHNIDHYREAFWETLRTAYPEELAKPVLSSIKPMTEQEAIEFENEVVPRGQFIGHSVYQVAMKYWHWWVEHKDSFTEKLERYLLSDRAKKRTRDEE